MFGASVLNAAVSNSSKKKISDRTVSGKSRSPPTMSWSRVRDQFLGFFTNAVDSFLKVSRADI